VACHRSGVSETVWSSAVASIIAKSALARDSRGRSGFMAIAADPSQRFNLA
jgi:hypothetical protein